MSEFTYEPTRAETDAIVEAGNALVSWWRGRKPRGWSEAQHLANPTVNMATPRERRLAHAAVKLRAHGW